MSTFIRIFCQSSDEITPQNIIDFIGDGVFCDPTPRFEIQDIAGHSWVIDIIYDPNKRPIRVAQNWVNEEWQIEITETLDVLAAVGVSELQQELSKYVARTRQVIAFEIDVVGLTEDGWECASVLESIIAKRLNGIIFADGDAFYDAQLQIILKL
jgi:hypothetical protein